MSNGLKTTLKRLPLGLVTCLLYGAFSAYYGINAYANLLALFFVVLIIVAPLIPFKDR